jgi:hypothetical protein
MNLIEIIGSQCIRLLPIIPRNPGALYGGNLFRAFEERYSFLQGPNTTSDYDFTKGISFLTGYFNYNKSDGESVRVIIEKCAIFNDGVVVEGKIDTEIIDSFIEDALDWLIAVAGPSVDNSSLVRRLYSSRIDVHAECNIGKALEKYNTFSKELHNTIRSYGTDPKELSPIGIIINSEMPEVPATRFVFERREGHPFDSGRYFSLAPLATKDHLRHLEDLERILA